MDFPDIPPFLIIPQAQRNALWVGRRLTKVKPGSVNRLRVEDASTRAFRRELERAAKAKAKARLDDLHEREREQRTAARRMKGGGA